MSTTIGGFVGRARVTLHKAVHGPHLIAFLPAIMLAGYWLGGETLLLILGLSLPATLVLTGLMTNAGGAAIGTRDGETRLPMRKAATAALDRFFAVDHPTGRQIACLVVAIDDFAEIEKRIGAKGRDAIIRGTAERLESAMRDTDLCVRLDGPVFAAIPIGGARADLETSIQICTRIQAAIAEPFSIDGTRVYVSCSVGFCLSTRSPEKTGAAMLRAAELALGEAQAQGGSSIRAFTEDMQKEATVRSELAEEIARAIELGDIRPWFQPQIATDTGEVTGFEALARWIHPERGVISPAEFLPLIADAGCSERMTEIMLNQALVALQSWDRSGFDVPSVAVNFSSENLRNPKLVDKIGWELDRFDIAPERLTIEVLETVIAAAGNDAITRNLAALSDLGCPIDLDDFGTGQASIASIRRFAIGRIKIDRSFVTKVDVDGDQQSMVSAIVTMADRLDLRTLAEGVETVTEQAKLFELGCGHVQGYVVARPMPFEDTVDWLGKHQAKLARSANPRSPNSQARPLRRTGN